MGLDEAVSCVGHALKIGGEYRRNCLEIALNIFSEAMQTRTESYHTLQKANDFFRGILRAQKLTEVEFELIFEHLSFSLLDAESFLKSSDAALRDASPYLLCKLLSSEEDINWIPSRTFMEMLYLTNEPRFSRVQNLLIPKLIRKVAECVDRFSSSEVILIDVMLKAITKRNSTTSLNIFSENISKYPSLHELIGGSMTLEHAINLHRLGFSELARVVARNKLPYPNLESYIAYESETGNAISLDDLINILEKNSLRRSEAISLFRYLAMSEKVDKSKFRYSRNFEFPGQYLVDIWPHAEARGLALSCLGPEGALYCSDLENTEIRNAAKRVIFDQVSEIQAMDAEDLFLWVFAADLADVPYDLNKAIRLDPEQVYTTIRRIAVGVGERRGISSYDLFFSDKLVSYVGLDVLLEGFFRLCNGHEEHMEIACKTIPREYLVKHRGFRAHMLERDLDLGF